MGSQRVGHDWDTFTFNSPLGPIAFSSVQFSSVQSLSHVWLFVAPWITAHQASLSITNSRTLPKPMSTESVIAFNHLILCHPLLLLPSIFPSIRVCSNESALRIRWPKYWSFSFRISPSNEHSGLIFFRISLLDLLAVQGTQVCHYQNQGILSQSEFGPKNDLAPVLGNLGSWIAYQEKKEPVINWVS